MSNPGNDVRESIEWQPIDPKLIQEIGQLCKEKGWREGWAAFPSLNGPQFVAYMMMVATELAEATEEYRIHRWSGEEQVIGPACSPCRTEYKAKSCGHQVPKPVGVGSEIADAIIRLLDTAEFYGVDINGEIRRKLDYNWTREYRHGGKEI